MSVHLGQRGDCLPLAAVALLALACGGPPLDFADWIIPVPEGTPILEYAPVPMDARDPDAIRLTDELVIAAAADDPQAALFEPVLVAGTADGTMFVADSAMSRVQMYGPDGAFIRSLGRGGQGPGEFDGFQSMTIAGDLLVIGDGGNRRFSTWSLSGEHVRDYAQETVIARSVRRLYGLADGTVVASGAEWLPDGGERTIIIRFSLDNEERARFDELTAGPSVIPEYDWTPMELAQAFLELMARPRRQLAAGAGLVYVTPVHDYQVLAFAADGSLAWALRVAAPRPAFSRHTKDVVASLTEAARQGFDIETVDWSGTDSAVADILTDGAGRLYVLPNIHFDGEPPLRVPADVYSRDGKRVTAGFLPALWLYYLGAPTGPWSHAAGDYVYGLREGESGETVAVRYRLELSQ